MFGVEQTLFVQSSCCPTWLTLKTQPYRHVSVTDAQAECSKDTTELHIRPWKKKTTPLHFLKYIDTYFVVLHEHTAFNLFWIWCGSVSLMKLPNIKQLSCNVWTKSAHFHFLLQKPYQIPNHKVNPEGENKNRAAQKTLCITSMVIFFFPLTNQFLQKLKAIMLANYKHLPCLEGKKKIRMTIVRK